MALAIKKAIKRKGFTIQEIAARLEIDRLTLTRQLNGNPTLKTLQRIAAAIDVPVTDLFDDEESETLTGFIEWDKNLYKVGSVEELEALLVKIQSDTVNR
ncbi:MAG: helix-turn-helix domain-containing protein [Flavobacteriaceae bacterium]|jgi:transcriptional regulator with XRE-family HTH domain|nr:helix-turn-helix domain-containing protein [Flavobacteriaceae bacterium]